MTNSPTFDMKNSVKQSKRNISNSDLELIGYKQHLKNISPLKMQRMSMDQKSFKLMHGFASTQTKLSSFVTNSR